MTDATATERTERCEQCKLHALVGRHSSTTIIGDGVRLAGERAEPDVSMRSTATPACIPLYRDQLNPDETTQLSDRSSDEAPPSRRL